MVETMKGRIVTSVTIDKDVRMELKRRGIPLGSACGMWLKHIDEKKDYTEQISCMTENITKMQHFIREQAQRIRELESEKEGV